MEPVDEFGVSAGEVDGAGVDVVEGEDAADEAVALVGHGHPEENPVEPGPPGVGFQALQVRGPVGSIEGAA